MSTVTTISDLFGAVYAELKRRKNNGPVFEKYPGVTIEDAEKKLRVAFGIPEGQPIDYESTAYDAMFRAGNPLHGNKEIEEYFRTIAFRKRRLPDIDSPEYRMEETPEFSALSDDEKLIAQAKHIVHVVYDKQLATGVDEETIENRLNGYNANEDEPHKLKFVPVGEREARREKSRLMGDAIMDCARNLFDHTENTRFHRATVTLLNYDTPDKPDPENEIIVDMFTHYDERDKQAEHIEGVLNRRCAKNPNLPREEVRAALENEIKNEWPKKRGEIAVKRVKEVIELYKKRNEMTDISLPIEQLCKNFRALRDASNISYEIPNFRNLVPEFMEITDDELKLFAECEEMQSELASAYEKLASIANPCYALFDVDELAYYKVYEIAADGKAGIEGKKLTTYKDSLSDYSVDSAFVERYKRMAILDDFNDIAAEYGLELRTGDDVVPQFETKRVTESRDEFANEPGANIDEIMNNSPIAMIHGDRVVIVCRESGASMKLECDKPEKLFNSRFKLKTDYMNDMMRHADPGYIHSSPKFRDMKEQYEKLLELGTLPENLLADTKSAANAINRFRREYAALVARTDDYLAYKTVKNPNDLEKRRIEMAKTLKEFGELKLEQLNIIERAVETYKNYGTLSPEDRKKAIAREKDIEKKLGNKILARSKMSDYINFCSLRYSDVPSVKNYFESVKPTFEAYKNDLKPFSETRVPQYDPTQLIGAVIVGSLIKKERAENNGKENGLYETLFTGADTEAYVRMLGNAALSYADKKYPGMLKKDNNGNYLQMSIEDFNKITDDKFVKELVASADEVMQIRPEITILKELAGKYRDCIPKKEGVPFPPLENAMRDYADEHILPGAAEFFGALANDKSVNTFSGCDLVADCVLLRVMQLEYVAENINHPGNIEQIMRDPKKTVGLKNIITQSEGYNALISKAFAPDENGEIHADRLYNALINGKEITNIAKGVYMNVMIAGKAPQNAGLAAEKVNEMKVGGKANGNNPVVPGKK